MLEGKATCEIKVNVNYFILKMRMGSETIKLRVTRFYLIHQQKIYGMYLGEIKV